MIFDNDGGKVYVNDDSPNEYSFTVHYTNSGRVEKWFVLCGQVSLIEDYGNPKDLKWRKQKKRTQTVEKQKKYYKGFYPLIIKFGDAGA